MEPGPSGPVRDPDDRGDLVEPETEIVVEDHHCPMLGRQRGEGTFEGVAIDDRIRDGRPGQVIHLRDDADDGRAPSSGMTRPIAGADEQSIQPGIEPGRVAQTRQVRPGRLQRVLHGVLRVVVVSQDP